MKGIANETKHRLVTTFRDTGQDFEYEGEFKMWLRNRFENGYWEDGYKYVM